MPYDPVKDGERRKPENTDKRNRCDVIQRLVRQGHLQAVKELEDAEPKPKPKPKPKRDDGQDDSWPL